MKNIIIFKAFLKIVSALRVSCGTN